MAAKRGRLGSLWACSPGKTTPTPGDGPTQRHIQAAVSRINGIKNQKAHELQKW